MWLSAGTVRAESITGFTASFDLKSDGKVRITETIDYDFGTLERHGIFRNIPYIKTNAEGKRFAMTFSDFSVLDSSGNARPYRLTRENDETVLKIGDPDRTVTGIVRYVIGYTVSGAVTYFSDHDEFYWNVTGNGWEIPIQTTEASVTFPGNIEPVYVKVLCFTGYEGSRESKCSADYRDNKALVTAGQLEAGQGLTIAVSVPTGMMAVLEPREVVNFTDTPLGAALLAVFGVVLFLFSLFWYIALPVYVVYRWWLYGRDPRPPMGETVWFDAPKTRKLRALTPGETGALVDETADLRDITATIVDLARRGFAVIEERKKNDFYIIKTAKSDIGSLQPFEEKLYVSLFASGDELRVKDARLVSEVESVKSKLYDALVSEGFFPDNPESVRTKYTLLGVAALVTLNLPLVLIAFIFGRAMPRKTLYGAQTAAVGVSLKNFLTSQEKPLGHQAKNQLFFEKLLPYAVAFGVERIWAERFSDITMQPPEWYRGYSWRSYNSMALTDSLRSSLGSVVRAATPTSSSSGFSSGFSGGSSGGGGGGGGGGSW
ncbi:hypothetical protein A2Z33_02515 [Candidatus Gottesmanbacteria bacterium RBG_16_52_11]|uniref:DUF2207 domain-containing protein n=1 Tax=Candidatus Gottesmanbacteria bacterium RBG_16_52_11 TaxID=1798374 RepID=A0A1F5YMI0_9BACT|nr:MAG: hypothetical protein A2Z33_02515 [Candidatus Gottesmanbacteria bacterium RBG_16_52_11]